jgi:DNA polymerase-3 subunit alpha
MIEPAADYSFNKSHAACYAFISYQTAWLKAHYPLEFHAALLRSVEQEPDKLA